MFWVSRFLYNEYNSDITSSGVLAIPLLGHTYTTVSREASDAGEFHLKTKSRDFRVIFDEKWRSTLRLKYVRLQ